MPRVNIWISSDNYDRWKALDNKSGFINSVLRYDVGQAVRMSQAAASGVTQVFTASSSVAPSSAERCPHGYIPARCKECPNDTQKKRLK